ncbi:MAG: hypothetical protein M3N16_01045 [Actinomycetota bacterium]|nr:hypothetical protein [Actinomycetota bacterium]
MEPPPGTMEAFDTRTPTAGERRWARLAGTLAIVLAIAGVAVGGEASGILLVVACGPFLLWAYLLRGSLPPAGGGF